MIFLPFAITLITIILLYILSKGKFNELINPLNKEEYPLKQFFPMGLYILKVSGCRFNTLYTMRLIIRCSELNDYKSSMFYVKILYANKIVLSLLMALVGTGLLAAYGSFDPVMIIFGIAILVAGFFAPDRDVIKRVEKRRLILRMDFPVFLNKLVLLINAGMTIGNAWERISNENNSKSIFYDEIRQTVARIKSGTPEIVAYEEFARRCRLPEISKFSSLINQNIIKGGSDFTKALKYQSSECWEMRKHAVMRLGEEASTKMLFPMTLMFIAVIIVVVAPAIIMLKG